MGRGKVHLRRIENKVSRQVTFSKRRSGLLKKARELAVLCDADVAAFVFSANGNLYTYSNQSSQIHFSCIDSMDKILERYQRCSLSEGGVMEEYSELEGSMNSDHILLRSQVEALRKSERNLMGEQLGSLTQRGFQQLEQQIGDALRSIRLRRDFLLANSIGELRNKERLLMEQNKILEREKDELLQASLHYRKRTAAFCNAAAGASLPNLNISIEDGDADDEPAGSAMAPVDRPGGGGTLPWWMLRGAI